MSCRLPSTPHAIKCFRNKSERNQILKKKMKVNVKRIPSNYIFANCKLFPKITRACSRLQNIIFLKMFWCCRIFYNDLLNHNTSFLFSLLSPPESISRISLLPFPALNLSFVHFLKPFAKAIAIRNEDIFISNSNSLNNRETAKVFSIDFL